jgi:nicotinate phosphoribosyltransferase
VSQDFAIPAQALYKAAWPQLGAQIVQELAAVSQEAWVEALKESAQDLQLNRGIAENLIKIQAMARACVSGECMINPSNSDLVNGLHPDAIAQMVAAFPPANLAERRAKEFNYAQLEREELLGERASNTDWYNLKMGFVMFMKGWHKSRTNTFHLFSRGAPNRAYFVSSGQYEVVSKLRHVRWSERILQMIKQHPHFRELAENPKTAAVFAEYIEYLRNWKFAGRIRGMLPGTVFFADEPILEVEANPLDILFSEVVFDRTFNTQSRTATEMARTYRVAGGRSVVEGATRRADDPHSVSLASVSSGARGTSNVDIALLWGADPYGSQAHLLIQNFGDEIDAHSAYLQSFPGSTLITDTYGAADGWRPGVISGQRKFAGIRLDSPIPGTDLFGGTVDQVRENLTDVGYGHVALGISNRASAEQLAANPNTGASWFLIGTQLGSPKDFPTMNMVFKMSQFQEHGKPPVITTKLSEGKPGFPGRLQIYRYDEELSGGSDGEKRTRFVRDLIAQADEPLDDFDLGGETTRTGRVRALFHDLAYFNPLSQTLERLQAEEPLATIARRSIAEVAALPEGVVALGAKPGGYLVEKSNGVRRALNEIRKKYADPKYSKIGVFFGAFNRSHKTHRDVVKAAMKLYKLDKVIIVPASDDYLKLKFKNRPVETVYNGEVRLKQLRTLFRDVDNIEFSRLEIDGRTSRAFDTLQAIQREQERGALIHIIAGSDLVESLPTWYRAADLVRDYNWIISPRSDQDTLQVPEEFLDGYYRPSDHPRILKNEKTGRFMHMVEVNAGRDSSTARRAESDDVDTVFHEVDMGDTFFEADEDRPAGTMAVRGSARILKNAVKLKIAARDDPRVKSIATKDYHFLAEVENPDRWNPEFKIFPQHGMASITGPAGHQRVRELNEVFTLADQDFVPNKRERVLPGGERILETVEWDLEAHLAEIRDPRRETVIHKQGVEWASDGQSVKTWSYDFGVNPRAEPIIKSILGEPGMSKHGRKKRAVVYGLATDWCVRAAAVRYAKMGYEVWVVSDAIAGIFEKEDPAQPLSKISNIEATFREFKELGIELKTTDEVLEVYGKNTNRSGCGKVLAEMSGAE